MGAEAPAGIEVSAVVEIQMVLFDELHKVRGAEEFLPLAERVVEIEIVDAPEMTPEVEIIEEEKGEKPILLLDDVLSELDNERQIYLMNMLGDNQMFITTTDITDKVKENLPEGKIFYIKGGKIQREEE